MGVLPHVPVVDRTLDEVDGGDGRRLTLVLKVGVSVSLKDTRDDTLCCTVRHASHVFP